MKCALEPKPTGLTRYIDDFWTCNMFPPTASYGMDGKQTSTDLSQVGRVPGVHVREGRVHTTVFEREEPWGRFVTCQDACTHMQDFKESAGGLVPTF